MIAITPSASAWVSPTGTYQLGASTLEQRASSIPSGEENLRVTARPPEEASTRAPMISSRA